MFSLGISRKLIRTAHSAWVRAPARWLALRLPYLMSPSTGRPQVAYMREKGMLRVLVMLAGRQAPGQIAGVCRV